jgi:N6-L-threonylcarbamoyladenine synthase
MKNFGQYQVLGETRDDAAGECFDKVARILGLGYPGGPIVAQMATKVKKQNEKLKINLPRPMINQKNYDFSFSGLKTAVLYDFKKRSPEIRQAKEYIQEMSAELQQAVIDVLIYKTMKAARNYRAQSIILGGGVAANSELRKQIKAACIKANFSQLIPPENLCTDNAVMVAITAWFHRDEQNLLPKIEAKANLRV